MLPYLALALLTVVIAQFAFVKTAFFLFRTPLPDFKATCGIVGLGFVPFVGAVLQFFALRRAYLKNRPMRWGEGIAIFLAMLLLSTLFSVASVYPLRTVVSPFRVSGNAMFPTYPDKTFMTIWKFRREYSTGDVVVYRPHAGNGKGYYVHRIIGTPGDTLKFIDGKAYLRKVGESGFSKLYEPYLKGGADALTTLPEGSPTEFTVPEGSYFLMGDNRSGSSDSRFCFSRNCERAGSIRYAPVEDVV